MAENPVNADVLIVGAGLAGLMAATVLEKNQIKVCVLDKGKSVGGRMATRRIGTGLADHGSQFFTAREPEFQKLVDQWIKEHLVYLWSTGFSDGSLAKIEFDGHPRYAVYEGMNALTKHIAKGSKNIRTEVKIVTATCDENGWILQDENGGLYLSKALLMTPPIPQSLEILDEGATILTREDQETLGKIEYAPCLTGLFWVKGKVTLPQPGAVQRRNANISWIADNQQKGISPDATIITVQASDQYSAQMWSAPDDRILNALRTDLQIYLRDDAEIVEGQVKRWRYSRPLNVYPERYLVADNAPLLMFAGDAFGASRVEGAVLSGLAAGKALVEKIAIR